MAELSSPLRLRTLFHIGRSFAVTALLSPRKCVAGLHGVGGLVGWRVGRCVCLHLSACGKQYLKGAIRGLSCSDARAWSDFNPRQEVCFLARRAISG